MIDRGLKEELASKRFEDFIIPSYESFCLSNVPAAIASFFGLKTREATLLEPYISRKVAVDDPRNIVLIVLDGFGYGAWLKAIYSRGFFQTVTDRGFVFPITTVFPSATPAALTTLATGLTPQEHGLPEWYVYLERLDMIIATLPFSPMGVAERDTLLGKMDPRNLFSGETVYRSLKRGKVDSLALIPSANSNSAYTRMALGGSQVIPYQSPAECAVLLRQRLKSLKRKTFFTAYYDSIDSIAHKCGPNSEEWRGEISALSQVLQREFLDKMDKLTARRTLLIVTADHGQINVNPNETVYLNEHRKLVRDFEKSPRGKTILPSWGARDLALHVREDKVDQVESMLSENLKGRALVLRTKEAVRMGLFGLNKASPRFSRRAGDILILPRQKNTIWYQHPEGKRFHFLGAHGGLTEDEVLIPFAASTLSDLTS